MNADYIENIIRNIEDQSYRCILIDLPSVAKPVVKSRFALFGSRATISCAEPPI